MPLNLPESHHPLPVKGYTEQLQWKVELVNRNKELEEMCLRQFDRIGVDYGNVDKRWVAIARTHLEQAFMAINRSIFQPQRVALSPEESQK